MPLMPKRTKFRKSHRGSRSGNAQTGTTVAFGDFGLQTLDRGWMTNRQIEACRIAINRSLKRKGKGAVEGWVAVIRPGNVLFEVGGVTESAAKEAMRLASYKLGIRTRLITRNPHS